MSNNYPELSETPSRLIVLWTAPRCVSTAFEKAFTQHPDVVTIHEPFQDIYYHSQWRRSDRLGNHKNCLDHTVTQVMEKIQSQRYPVIFVKEMAYQALPYIDHEFVNAPFANTFLIRNPKKSLLSWYKLGEFPTEEEFGFDALQSMWQFVIETQNYDPVIVEADRLQSDPEKTLKAYCQALKINFESTILSWNQGCIQQENSHKEKIHRKWHQTLSGSRGIMPPTKAIGEVCPDDMPMLERAEKIYKRLCQFALE